MNGNPANLTAFLMTMGGMAGSKKAVKLAPGGVGHSRPAPSKIRAPDGITDSEFIGNVLRASGQASGGSTGVLTPPMQAPQQAAAPPGGGMGGLAALLGGMGGGE